MRISRATASLVGLAGTILWRSNLCAGAECGCTDENGAAEQDMVMFNTSGLAAFKHPWRLLNAGDHVDINDPRSEVMNKDDCAVASDQIGHVIFSFGGKDKFGASSESRLFWPTKCICSDDYFTGCESGCKSKDQIHGVFTSALPADYPPDDIPAAREDHLLEEHGGEFYIFGGTKQTNYGDLYKYNWRHRNFTRLRDFPAPARKDLSGAFVNDKFVIFSGIEMSTKDYVNDVWAYDVPTDTWTQLWDARNDTTCDSVTTGVHSAVCPPALEDASAIGSNAANGLLVVGGATEEGERSPRSWFFSLNTNTWSPMLQDVLPPADEDHAFARIEGEEKAILQGGRMSSVYHLNMGADVSQWFWTEIPQVAPSPLVKDHSTAFVNGTLYAMFGDGPLGKSDDVWVYDYASKLCPHECIHRGICSEYGVCTCEQYLQGADCNIKQVENTFLVVSGPVSVACAVVASGALVGAVGMAAALVSQRAKRSIKVANFPMLLACVLGCALTAVGLIVRVALAPTDAAAVQPSSVRCLFEPVFFPMCFGICFGALYAKAKTVDRMFDLDTMLTLKAKRKTSINGYFHTKMLLDVVQTVSLQAALIVVWMSTDSFQEVWQVRPVSLYYEQVHYLSCKSVMGPTWVLIFVLVNSITVVHTGYLTWQHRDKEALGNIKSLCLSILSLLLVGVPAIFLTQHFADSPNASLLVSTIGISLTVAGVLAFAVGSVLFRSDAGVTPEDYAVTRSPSDAVNSLPGSKVPSRVGGGTLVVGGSRAMHHGHTLPPLDAAVSSFAMDELAEEAPANAS